MIVVQQVIVTVSANIFHSSLFSPTHLPFLSCIHPGLNQPSMEGIYHVPTNSIQSLKEFAMTFQKEKKKKNSDGQTYFKQVTFEFWVFFPFLMLFSGLSDVCILTSQPSIGKKIWQS